MTFLQGQRIQFKGRDGEKRAAAFAAELGGAGKQIGSDVFLTRPIELRPVVLAQSKEAHA